MLAPKAIWQDKALQLNRKAEAMMVGMYAFHQSLDFSLLSCY